MADDSSHQKLPQLVRVACSAFLPNKEIEDIVGIVEKVIQDGLRDSSQRLEKERKLKLACQERLDDIRNSIKRLQSDLTATLVARQSQVDECQTAIQKLDSQIFVLKRSVQKIKIDIDEFEKIEVEAEEVVKDETVGLQWNCMLNHIDKEKVALRVRCNAEQGDNVEFLKSEIAKTRSLIGHQRRLLEKLLGRVVKHGEIGDVFGVGEPDAGRNARTVLCNAIVDFGTFVKTKPYQWNSGKDELPSKWNSSQVSQLEMKLDSHIENLVNKLN